MTTLLSIFGAVVWTLFISWFFATALTGSAFLPNIRKRKTIHNRTPRAGDGAN